MTGQEQIESFEGRRLVAYPDPLTGGAPWTIGIGHCGPEVCAGLVWNDDQVDDAFELDYASAWQCCADHVAGFGDLNDPRQSVLVNMAFQMGCAGMRGFAQFIAAVGKSDWNSARMEMLSSAWARQTPERALKLSNQILSGEWCF